MPLDIALHIIILKESAFSLFACWVTVLLKSTFSQKSDWNTIRVANSLDPDQAQPNVGPDLGPNCLKRLSVDKKNHHPQVDSESKSSPVKIDSSSESVPYRAPTISASPSNSKGPASSV